MRVSNETVTTCLGPGLRYVIWTQGCDKNCKGCINPEGRNALGGYEISVDEILDKIEMSIAKHADLCGITISGGEPFLQLDDLSDLINRVKKDTGLDVMIYTGYEMKDIYETYGEKVESLISQIDILIDGEFKEELNAGEALRGSNNQKLYFPTGKYNYKDLKLDGKREFSFEIKGNGDIYFVGIPPVGFYENFLKAITGGKDL